MNRMDGTEWRQFFDLGDGASRYEIALLSQLICGFFEVVLTKKHPCCRVDNKGGVDAWRQLLKNGCCVVALARWLFSVLGRLGWLW